MGEGTFHLGSGAAGRVGVIPRCRDSDQDETFPRRRRREYSSDSVFLDFGPGPCPVDEPARDGREVVRVSGIGGEVLSDVVERTITTELRGRDGRVCVGAEEFERMERRRISRMSAMIAVREVRDLKVAGIDGD